MPTSLIEARAFRIWQYANPRDWNVTYQELQDALGLSRGQVIQVIRDKEWGGRILENALMVSGERLAQYKKDRAGPKDLFFPEKKRLCDPLTAPVDELMATPNYAGAND